MFEPKYYEQLEKNQSRDGGIPGEGTFNLGALKRKGAAAKVSAYFFEHSRLPYWLLRKFFPVLRLGQVAIVTRYADVKQILTQPEAFEVPFGREMTELVAGQNAVLGMNDLAEHKVALDHIRCVFSASDLEPRIGVPSAQFAREVLDESGGRIDIIKDLMALVPTKVCRDYYGLDIDDEDAFAEWTIAVSTMLFGDPFGDLATRELGLTAGACCARRSFAASPRRTPLRPRTGAEQRHRPTRLLRDLFDFREAATRR